MDLKISAELLNKIPLLHGVESVLLQQLAQAMRVKKVGKKEFVIHKGEAGNELLFLIDGRLLVVNVSPDGRQTGLNFLTPGDFFGEQAVIDDLPRSASVMAVSNSILAGLPKTAAREFIFHNPVIAERMLRHISLKLRAATDFRALIAIPNAYERVLKLTEMLAKPAGQLLTIENMPTHEQLALMANTSRETVTRAFQLLQDEQVIEKESRRLVIRFPDKLNIIIQRIHNEKEGH
ncbi:MAG: Crp/Fnr family transcriptional regulator [Gammaproteobacteria bacterium]|nr:Crp/Fnr family transcriptional regulator [Gammaproteobacteria bacterium]